jgi:hypothetical protein
VLKIFQFGAGWTPHALIRSSAHSSEPASMATLKRGVDVDCLAILKRLKNQIPDTMEVVGHA